MTTLWEYFKLVISLATVRTVATELLLALLAFAVTFTSLTAEVSAKVVSVTSCEVPSVSTIYPTAPSTASHVTVVPLRVTTGAESFALV